MKRSTENEQIIISVGDEVHAEFLDIINAFHIVNPNVDWVRVPDGGPVTLYKSVGCRPTDLLTLGSLLRDLRRGPFLDAFNEARP
jgi:hypothetical protein